MGAYAHFPIVFIKVCNNNSVDSRTRGLSRGLWENHRDTEQNRVQMPSLSDGRQDVTFLRQQTDNSSSGENRKDHFFPRSSSSGWQKSVENGRRGQDKPSIYFREITHTHTLTQFWVIMIINTIGTSALGPFHVGLRGNVRNFPSTN